MICILLILIVRTACEAFFFSNMDDRVEFIDDMGVGRGGTHFLLTFVI